MPTATSDRALIRGACGHDCPDTCAWTVEVQDGTATRLAGDPAHPLGNGVAIWFEVDDLEAAAERARTLGATVQTDIHHNPNADHYELWLRDPDNYLVVLASHPSSR